MAYNNQQQRNNGNHRRNQKEYTKVPNFTCDNVKLVANDDVYDTVNDILGKIPWKEFSVSINAKKEDVFGSGNRGICKIGFITNYENGVFTVCIFGKYKEYIQSKLNNPTISPKVFINHSDNDKIVVTDLLFSIVGE